MYNKTHEPQILMPTNDLNFKRLFASPQHINISTGFLQDLAEYDPLGYLKISSFTIETPYNFKDVNQLRIDSERDMMLTEVDYACVDEDGMRFMLEMQKRDLSYLEERIVYNVGQKYAQRYSLDAKKHSKYSTLTPVIAVVILEDNHFNDDVAIRFMRPYDARHNVYKNSKNLGLEIYIEINKPADNLPKNLQYWLQYFRTGRVPKCAPDYINEAMTMSEISSLSKEERDLADLIERIEQKRIAEDLAAKNKAMTEGFNQGFNQGIEQGENTKAIEIAKSMLVKELELLLITELTGLTMEEVERLQ